MPTQKIPSYLRLEPEHVLFIVFAAYIFIFHSHMGADYYWHLEAGEFLANFRAIPSGDPFSFTFAGEPWVLHEWLFEIGLYRLYTLAGHYGVKLAIAAVMSLALFTLYRAAVAVSSSRSYSIVITAVTLLIYFEFALPRPQVVTYLFFAVYLYILLGYKFRTHRVRLYWLPLIMVLWVNMHAGYLIGIVLLALFILTEVAERLLERENGDELPPALKPLLQTLALCLVASLLNPYTYNQWLYPFQVMSLTATDSITEWKSPDFHKPLFKGYLLYLIGFFFLQNYTARRASLGGLLVPFSFITMSIVSVRHVPLALLATLPHYALTLRNLHLPWRRQGAMVQALLPRFDAFKRRARSAGSPAKAYLLSWALLALLLPGVVAMHYAMSGRLDTFDNWAVPIGAVEFVNDNGIAGNVLNQYGQGGYLIFSLYPHSKVFIDGRADLYGDKFFTTHQTIVNAGDGWQKLLARYDIDYVLLPNDTPVLWPLNAGNEFKLVYCDEANSVLLRNNDKFRDIIDKYGKYFDNQALRDLMIYR